MCVLECAHVWWVLNTWFPAGAVWAAIGSVVLLEVSPEAGLEFKCSHHSQFARSAPCLVYLGAVTFLHQCLPPDATVPTMMDSYSSGTLSKNFLLEVALATLFYHSHRKVTHPVYTRVQARRWREVPFSKVLPFFEAGSLTEHHPPVSTSPARGSQVSHRCTQLPWLFPGVLGTQAQVLLLVWQTHYHLSHLPSSLPPL